MDLPNSNAYRFIALRFLHDWWWLIILFLVALTFTFPLGLIICLILIWRICEVALSCVVLHRLNTPERSRDNVRP